LAVGVSNRGASALASLGLVLALPTALFGLASGVLIDHTNKFRLLIKTDVVRAVIVTAVGFIFLSARPNLPLVLVLAGMLAIVSVLFAPGLQALLPEMNCGKDEILSMDVWILGAVGTVAVIGPVVSGTMLGLVGPQVMMWTDAATFIWSAFMLAGARRRLPTRQKDDHRPANPITLRSKATSVADGLRFVLSHDVLRPCFTTFPLMEFATYSVPFLLPLVLSNHSAATSGIYGISLAALGGGRLLGMVLVNRTTLKQRRGLILRGNFLFQGIPIVVAAIYAEPVLIPIVLMLIGVASGAAQVAMSSYVQVEIPAHMRGRVFSSLISMTSWLQPLGALIFGLVAAAFNAWIAFILIGLVLAVGGSRMFFAKSVAGIR